MPNPRKDNPGVIAPPPLIFSSGLIFGGFLQWFCTIRLFPVEFLFPVRIAGILLIFFGLGTILAAHLKMKRAKTNIEPWKPTTAIIADGIYSVSRNPVYVAMVFVYLGLTLIFNAFWLLPFLILILITMRYAVISREETYLEAKFGEVYSNYKKRVRRWF